MNWDQLRAILWLRWRLTRNQMTRSGGVGAVISILAAVILIVVALGLGVGAVLVGALGLKNVEAWVVMLVWDGVTALVLFFSLIGVLTEVQRSESIDLARLLHLPISLRQVFVFNYLISLVSLSTVAGLAIMLGLATGLALSHGLWLGLLIPLVLAFSFMVTTWLYHLRGWLVSLMVNQRKRRTIIMWITLSIVLVSQSPQLINVYFQRRARAERETRRASRATSATNSVAQGATGGSTEAEIGQQLLDANAKAKEVGPRMLDLATRTHPWVPVLWLANGARGLAATSGWPALWGGAGMIALGWWGLRRSYRSTLRFYRGEGQMAPAKLKPAVAVKSRPTTNWIECRLPWVPEDSNALALAQLRAIIRAPEIKMMLGMGLFMPILVPMMLFWGAGTRLPDVAKPFVGTGLVAMVMLMSLQLACNQFGFDREGFRGLVLLPTPRGRLLLGKNLALLPVFAVITLVPLLAVSVLAKLPILDSLAALVQFVAAFLLVCLLGNLSSILLPYRITAGSLKPTKPNWRSAVGMLAIMMVFPIMISPIFVPAASGWLAQKWLGLNSGFVDLAGSVLLCASLLFLYRALLPPLGRLLQRREAEVLRAVTEGAE